MGAHFSPREEATGRGSKTWYQNGPLVNGNIALIMGAGGEGGVF